MHCNSDRAGLLASQQAVYARASVTFATLSGRVAVEARSSEQGLARMMCVLACHS